MPLRVLGYYFLGWALPGAWVGAAGEALFGNVPAGWFICFPNLKPAFVSGFCLAVLLPLWRPPRLSPIQFGVYGVAAPLLVTLVWLFVNDPPLVLNPELRWWVSNQVPAMLVGSCCAVYGAFEQTRLNETDASTETPSAA